MDRSYEERSFGEILEVANTQYEVPFFQRGYVWNNEKWKELLNDVLREICDIEVATSKDSDIRVACSERMEKIEDDRLSENFRKQKLLLWNHYIYKTNKTQNPQGPGALARFLIIDGQQRLITIYLFLMKIYYDLYRENAYERLNGGFPSLLIQSRDRELKIFTLKRNDQDLLEIVGKNHDMEQKCSE